MAALMSQCFENKAICLNQLKVLQRLFHSNFRRVSTEEHLRNPAANNKVSVEEEEDKLYQTIDVEVKGHDPAVINSYEKFVSMAAHELNANIGRIWSKPRSIERYTILKSAHVHRKHMVQYEMRTLYRCIELRYITQSTADTLLEYIQRNLPEGMAMKVTRNAIERMPSHLKRNDVKAQNKDQ